MGNSEKQIVLARISDAVKICEQRNSPKFVGFLNAAESAAAINIANRLHANYMMFAGFDEGERVFFGAFPRSLTPSADTFPISVISFTFRESDKLSHRDFLGAFMSLGIERDTIGDILVGTGKATVFVQKSIADFILTQIATIGSCAVKAQEGSESALPQGGGFANLTDTVASLRLDSVIASLLKCSRRVAVEFIESGLVAINGAPHDKITFSVKGNDKISVRGKGKFIIYDTSDVSKKGRTILKYKKYL